jgi:RNA polymerase sigma-70 factor (ECF subfamily)
MLKIAEGNHAAFNKLYSKYFATVISYIAGHTDDVSNHEDLAQKVFLRIWQARGGFRGQSAVRTYILGITKNVLREHRRQLQSQTSIPHRLGQLSSLSEPGVVLDKSQLNYAIRLAKLKLSDKQRQALELVFYSGLSLAEAARLAGCSEGTFRRRLYDAKKRLVELLEQYRPHSPSQRRAQGPKPFKSECSL